MTTDEFLTPEQVAALLQVHIMSVYGWLNSGKLQGFKAGSQWRIRKEDVDTFLGGIRGTA